jgi:hypothetical protein
MDMTGQKIFKMLGLAVILEALRRLLGMAISGAMAEADIISMRDAVLEVDIGSVGSWAAVESWSNLVEPTRGTVPTSEEKTLDGENHTGYGTKGNATVRVTAFFTTVATAPFLNLYDLLSTPVEVRWSKTGLASDIRFYTDGGILTECSPPGNQSRQHNMSKENGTKPEPVRFECKLTAWPGYFTLPALEEFTGAMWNSYRAAFDKTEDTTPNRHFCYAGLELVGLYGDWHFDIPLATVKGWHEKPDDERMMFVSWLGQIMSGYIADLIAPKG